MSTETSQKKPDPRCIVALDFDAVDAALGLAEKLDPQLCRVKVGKEIFVWGGPCVIGSLHEMGHEVFLDLKFHDIPNTVARACAAAANQGVWMMNVHVSGGRRMMEAARAAIHGSNSLLIGVTVLTSLAAPDLAEIGLPQDPQQLVVKWAKAAEQSGLDGVVCSPADLLSLRAEVGASFLTVTPGVRPKGSAAGDQRRVATPLEAVSRGASYLVIGRPITAAADPVRALHDIVAELEA
jgi:orotidine-5'-phosphate decarboxylase